MADLIRILRVIEYTGPREKVEDQVARSLHGEKRLPNGVTIKAATVGAYPELLQELPVIEGWPGAPAPFSTTKINPGYCPSCAHPHHSGSCAVTTCECVG